MYLSEVSFGSFNADIMSDFKIEFSVKRGFKSGVAMAERS